MRHRIPAFLVARIRPIDNVNVGVRAVIAVIFLGLVRLRPLDLVDVLF